MAFGSNGRLAIDKGFGFDLYADGEFVRCVATVSEAEAFVSGHDEG